MQCPRCLAPADATAAFCARCGSPLRESPSLAAAEAADAAAAAAEEASIAQELRAALAPRYEVLDLLGRGGMALVFRAREESLHRLVAVKVLSPRLAEAEHARTRFTREARAVAALSHPNVLAVYGVGETPTLGLPYMVMQYVEGPTLATMMQSRPRSPERAARRIVGEIAAALGAAHARGIVHRDVKPANVLIEGSSGRAIVVDFGISAVLAGDAEEAQPADVTATGAIVGTPIYMSPEQSAGERVGTASDVYSLGMVAYELFAGTLPFEAKSAMGWAAAHLRDTPKPLATARPDIAPDIARLVDRCLEKHSSARPLANDVAAGMSPSLHTDVQWPPPGLGPLLGRGHRAGRLAALLAIAVIIIAVCLASPPALVRADAGWWSRYAEGLDLSDSPLGVVTQTGAPARSPIVWAWWAALIAGSGATIVAGAMLLALGARAASRAARARRSGCSWETLTDVMADPDGRNGLLLAGAREMAAVEPQRRSGALRARRVAVIARVAAGVWAASSLAVWSAAVLLGVLRLDGSGAVMPLAAFLCVVVPGVTALVAAAFAARTERRSLAPLPRRQPFAASHASSSAPTSDGELAAWYDTLPSGRRPVAGSTSATSRGLIGAVTAALVALAIGSAVAVALVVAASFIAARNLAHFGPETARVVTTERRLRESDPFGKARTAWTAYLPAPSPMSDSADRATLRRLALDPSVGDVVPDYDVPPSRLLGTGADNLRASVSDAIKGAADGLPADSATLFATAAHHPRTELVRQLGGSDVDLLGAMLDRPMSQYESLAALPAPPYAQLRAGAQANALGAVVAVARGDYDDARRRLGENAGVAEQLLRMPIHFAGTFGAVLLQELALLPLAEIEARRGDPMRSVQLRSAADTVRELLLEPAWRSRLVGLAATPDDMSHYRAALHDRQIPAGVRGEAFTSAFTAFCLNAREIVAGPSSLRLSEVRHAADSIPDLPHAPGLAAFAISEWNGSTPADRGAHATVLTRLRLCSKMARN